MVSMEGYKGVSLTLSFCLPFTKRSFRAFSATSTPSGTFCKI